MEKETVWAIILAILGILLSLGIFALSICGIVFGAIDMAHGIYNAKSICFLVFGIIGVLGDTGGCTTIIINN